MFIHNYDSKAKVRKHSWFFVFSNCECVISIYIDYHEKGVNEEKILDGVCIAVKDNINVKGFKTSAGTKALQNYSPDQDAVAIKKLRDAGAIIIGMEDDLK